MALDTRVANQRSRLQLFEELAHPRPRTISFLGEMMRQLIVDVVDVGLLQRHGTSLAFPLLFVADHVARRRHPGPAPRTCLSFCHLPLERPPRPGLLFHQSLQCTNVSDGSDLKTALKVTRARAPLAVALAFGNCRYNGLLTLKVDSNN